MRGAFFFCFLLALPAAAIMGHDLWLSYTSEDLAAPPAQFSDLGWLWTHYGPQSYDWATKAVDPEIWHELVVPLLKQTAWMVLAVPPAALFVLLSLMKILGIGPFRGEPGILRRRGDYSFGETPAQKKRMRYKRRS